MEGENFLLAGWYEPLLDSAASRSQRLAAQTSLLFRGQTLETMQYLLADCLFSRVIWHEVLSSICATFGGLVPGETLVD